MDVRAAVRHHVAPHQQTCGAHLKRCILHRRDHMINVGVIMRRGHIAGETLQHEHAAVAQARTQKAAVFLILANAQIHQGPAVRHLERHVIIGKPAVHCACQPVALGIDGLPEKIRLGFEKRQHRLQGSHCQRMTHESTRKEGNGRLGETVIAVLPRTAIEGVHEAGFARHHAHRHAAADNFAIGHKISINAVIPLRAARAKAKACHHLVEN